MVLAPVFLLEKFDIDVLAVVFFKLHFIAQYCGALEYVAFVEVVEDPCEFILGQGGIVVFFQLCFEVFEEVVFVIDFDVGIAQFDELIDQVIFEGLFGLGCHGSLLNEHLL